MRYQAGDIVVVEMADGSVDYGRVENNGDDLYGHRYYRTWLSCNKRYTELPVRDSDPSRLVYGPRRVV